jgi:hypothetical protein
MDKDFDASEKDRLLRDGFSCLKPRGITPAWANSPQPYTELRDECNGLMRELPFRAELSEYLRVRSILPRSLTMFFTYIAMSARADWRSVPQEVRPIAARGWFLGRWLPTFLIIDGPIGRFVCGQESPLRTRLDTAGKYPLLTSARDFLGDRLFKLLRNGFAHWGFEWEVVGSESYVIAYDWERDLPIAKLHQKEADAFHIIAFALVEILHDVLLSEREIETGPRQFS